MNREQRRAQERAIRRTQSAGGDVDIAAMQAELEHLRALRTGTYALMQVLVSRMVPIGLPIEIPRADWKALPPKQKLRVKVDPETNDVRLWVEREADEASVEGV